MRGMDDDTRRSGRRSARVAALAVVVLLLAVVAVGCGGESSTILNRDATGPESVNTTTVAYGEPAEGDDGYDKAGFGQETPGIESTTGGLPVTDVLDRLVISNASLLIEVEKGKFQLAFDNALLLADKYGGYVVSSRASATGDESAMRSGTIAIRVPESAFAQTVADASKLGEVKSRDIDTQDVTEEYVDLKARLTNAQAQEKALLALLERAKTIDEILQVRQFVSQTQMEIEQLKGRIRFLDEHTSFSTVAMSLYEPGADVGDPGDWGFIDAILRALHAFVDSVNEIIVALGGALPVLAFLALLGWLAYKLLRPLVRRFMPGSRQPEAAQWTYDPQQQSYPGPYGPPAAQAPATVDLAGETQASSDAGPADEAR